MAIDDLSELAANSIWATCQHAGQRPSDPSVAMTAPGSPSPSVDESATSPAGGGGDISMQPFVIPRDYQGTHAEHGGDWSPPGPPSWAGEKAAPWLGRRG